MKRCPSCKHELSKTAFGKNAASRDGLQSECNSCRKIRRDKNRKTEVERATKWYHANKDRKRIYDIWYCEVNRPKRRAASKKWAATHPGKKLADVVKRRLALRQRVPAWAELNLIREFYAKCPKGFHVDHIIPLRGKSVCGLHVLNNLQYLPAEENLKKFNRFSTYPAGGRR